jgi:hypothetical protein
MIWEGGTKDDIRIFEALFKGVSTRFGLRTIEKSIEIQDVIFCSFFQIHVWGEYNSFMVHKGHSSHHLVGQWRGVSPGGRFTAYQ